MLYKHTHKMYHIGMTTKYTIEVVNSHEQTPYEGSIQDRLHVMHKLAQRFKSNIRLWASWPVDDGQGCVDFETEIIHEVNYQAT